jgi:hypothetical protein
MQTVDFQLRGLGGFFSGRWGDFTEVVTEICGRKTTVIAKAHIQSAL